MEGCYSSAVAARSGDTTVEGLGVSKTQVQWTMNERSTERNTQNGGLFPKNGGTTWSHLCQNGRCNKYERSKTASHHMHMLKRAFTTVEAGELSVRGDGTATGYLRHAYHDA